METPLLAYLRDGRWMLKSSNINLLASGYIQFMRVQYKMRSTTSNSFPAAKRITLSLKNIPSTTQSRQSALPM
jgi:hypothetical protein